MHRRDRLGTGNFAEHGLEDVLFNDWRGFAPFGRQVFDAGMRNDNILSFRYAGQWRERVGLGRGGDARCAVIHAMGLALLSQLILAIGGDGIIHPPRRPACP
ncbi:MAG: hypothetical protein MO852_01205 [Candidatus Devosia euplotis]|nr:hypothetical protein [Candidatus Devosia euplotis]